MPLLFVLTFLVQLGLAVHVVRTGRDTRWIYLILFVPGFGSLLYAITQLLPEVAGSRAARDTQRRVVRTIDPQRELRRRLDELDISDTVANRVALADECMEAGMFDKAEELYGSALRGVHGDDSSVRERLARAQFDGGRAAEAVRTLDELIEADPDYRSHDGHLLYARALEGAGREAEAVKEYEVLREQYPGEEARVRFALLRRRLGQSAGAVELLEESLLRARRAPRTYRDRERDWLRVAEKELAALRNG